MNGMSRQALWLQLCDNGLVEGELPPRRMAQSPWFVRVMLGMAGWVGALFLLGFVGAAFSFVMNSAVASLVLGGLCCAGAYVLFRTAPEHDFATQFGLAVSLAGQAMIGVGVFKALFADSVLAYAALFVIEVVLAILMPNFIHRVFSSWMALVFLWLGMVLLGIHGIAQVLAAIVFAGVWLNEPRWMGRNAAWRPIGYGAALALLQIDASVLFEHSFWMRTSPAAGWLVTHALTVGAVLVGVVFLVVVLRLLSNENVSPFSPAGIAAVLAVLLLTAVSCNAPGIATSLLILLLGFAGGNHVLMGIGLLALGAFLSHYYYQLQTTLLVKSMILAVSGLVMLLVRVAMQKWCASATGEGANE